MGRRKLFALIVVFGILVALIWGRFFGRGISRKPGVQAHKGSSSLPTSMRPTPELECPTASPWMVSGSLSTARSLHTATLLLSGKVLVVGGYEYGRAEERATAELYDPETERWTETGALLDQPRLSGHTATLLASGKVLVVSKTSAKLYEPQTGSWKETGSPIRARDDHLAVQLLSGKVLVAGGYEGGRWEEHATAELYDPETERWIETGALLSKPPVYGPTATLLVSGKVLMIAEKTVELYDPETGCWEETGSLAKARRGHTAVLLPSGKVLVAGGLGADGNDVLTISELYDPDTGTWTATGSLRTGRTGHTALLLRSGKVLVAGGRVTWPESQVMASCELYDPATGVWTEAAALSGARAHHTAALLSSGKVLVIGGKGDLGVALASTELYDPEARASGAIVSSTIRPPLPPTGTVVQHVLFLPGYGTPLAIVTRDEGIHYLVKLVDANSGLFVLKVFVRSGETAELDVPIGTYIIKYAAGKTWYGEGRLFGPGTIYAKADRTFNFAKRDRTVEGHKIELWVRPGGNLRTVGIRPEEF